MRSIILVIKWHLKILGVYALSACMWTHYMDAYIPYIYSAVEKTYRCPHNTALFKLYSYTHAEQEFLIFCRQLTFSIMRRQRWNSSLPPGISSARHVKLWQFTESAPISTNNTNGI